MVKNLPLSPKVPIFILSAFQDSTNHIFLFSVLTGTYTIVYRSLVLTNMSISDSNKSFDKCILRELKLCSHETYKSKSCFLQRYVSTQWLLSGHMSPQYVLCGHMSAQYPLCRRFCWFPHPSSIVTVGLLPDTLG